MKRSARIIHIANHCSPHEETLVGGKPFDLILEIMQGPKRRIALKINYRKPDAFMPFTIHLGQEQTLTFNQKTKEVVCHSVANFLKGHKKQVFEGQLVSCPQHFLKHYSSETSHLQPCKK
jgi:hypothetical protein